MHQPFPKYGLSVVLMSRTLEEALTPTPIKKWLETLMQRRMPSFSRAEDLEDGRSTLCFEDVGFGLAFRSLHHQLRIPRLNEGRRISNKHR